MDQTDCSVYGKDYACSDEFKEWAKATCPRFCGLCNGRKRIYNTLTKKIKPKLFKYQFKILYKIEIVICIIVSPFMI